jgi:RNA-directed DNA polymerase
VQPRDSPKSMETRSTEQELAPAEAGGSPGVDGMTIDDARDYLCEHCPSIRSQLHAGTYQPQPVKRVEIPKPEGGVRKLGVPCVVDRLIQQALLQVLQEQWDPTFSEHSYGFRPGRSAHQAVAQAQRYVAEGYGVVVDLDLEKFFDRVNHDRLMARVAGRVTDKPGAQAHPGVSQVRSDGRWLGQPGG